MNVPQAPNRRKLPDQRPGITKKVTIGNMDVYVTVNFYDDTDGNGGTRSDPAEVFVKVAKHGSDISGLMDGWAVSTSVALQYGVPWPVMRDKALHTKFGVSDDRSSSMLHAVAKAIDEICAERTSVIGESESKPRNEPVANTHGPSVFRSAPDTGCHTKTGDTVRDQHGHEAQVVSFDFTLTNVDAPTMEFLFPKTEAREAPEKHPVQADSMPILPDVSMRVGHSFSIFPHQQRFWYRMGCTPTVDNLGATNYLIAKAKEGFVVARVFDVFEGVLFATVTSTGLPYSQGKRVEEGLEKSSVNRLRISANRPRAGVPTHTNEAATLSKSWQDFYKEALPILEQMKKINIGIDRSKLSVFQRLFGIRRDFAEGGPVPCPQYPAHVWEFPAYLKKRLEEIADNKNKIRDSMNDSASHD